MLHGGGATPWSLWAKSDAAGRTHSLPGHLLDSGAVGELIWDEFMAPASRRALNERCAGRGRDVLVLLCAWHDLGKATPAFQAQVSALAESAARVGWTMPPHTRVPLKHGASGCLIAQRVLSAAGASGFEWLLPIIHGHHGSFLLWSLRQYQGSVWQQGESAAAATWLAGQDALAGGVADAFGVDVGSLALDTPPRALQLAAAGWVSMADWIASSSLFPGMGDEPMTVDDARARARAAWLSLGLAGRTSFPGVTAPFRERFGVPPRPLQQMVVDVAERMSAPGLLIVEGPMGEGKTEAALAAVEVMAARFGYDGFLFAMPTQGTTDAMYDRCRAWSRTLDSQPIVSLNHGKAMANEAWREQLAPVFLNDVCDVGDDDYGLATNSRVPGSPAAAPAEWLLGRHRGLLSPCIVATVDQPLMAATQVKYVSLRYAGLIGKVIVIDEVHSYDVFMSRYLEQLLRWCGDGRIPVVLMSATLPPAQRQALLAAYAEGLERGLETEVPPSSGYPCITSWNPVDGVTTSSAEPMSTGKKVAVLWAGIADPDDTAAIADVVGQQGKDGGCVLVVLNTVRRAQEVYAAIRDQGGHPTLLHGRLTTGARADRTRHLVAELGSGSSRRPKRKIVVATQIAEQSFDVDADVLVTDIAPMDLLLQRIGRLHRHKDNDAGRPAHLAAPKVVVTGCVPVESGPPRMPRAFGYVYDSYSLLRTAQLIGAGATWTIPSDIPSLVSAAYDEAGPWPGGWKNEGGEALAEARSRAAERSLRASEGVLQPDPNALDGGRTLDRLHAATGVERRPERISVRDGEPSREVALVRWDEERQRYTTLGGRVLGPTGEGAHHDGLAREVLADTVRVRQTERLHETPEGPPPLPGWAGSDLLRSVPALVLDAEGRAYGAWGSASYDEEIGLVIERTLS
ncbi:CRISPR-associated helicase Cas3' [Knoellia koreensis]|uniref:CRISPR-associated helicase Cas3 n=1 Tax=Knoellia koreensis TaxID=2730921 RepID=A0A849HIG7_9MICO|nr:CRISPR-associated helicase Cas3' [Knoellia sp. DB2414S]NNM46443.1 CRISPR-associated helicase Cas3' [Knoellia sp. DB2414S]